MLATVQVAQRDRWDVTAELLAAILLAVDYGNRQVHVAHQFKGPAPKPVQIIRPGETEKPKLTREAMRAILMGG